MTRSPLTPLFCSRPVLMPSPGAGTGLVFLAAPAAKPQKSRVQFFAHTFRPYEINKQKTSKSAACGRQGRQSAAVDCSVFLQSVPVCTKAAGKEKRKGGAK